MSVVMEQTIALKYVETLKEASIVNAILALYWMLMELLVMVCTRNIYIVLFGSAILKLKL